MHDYLIATAILAGSLILFFGGVALSEWWPRRAVPLPTAWRWVQRSLYRYELLDDQERVRVRCTMDGGRWRGTAIDCEEQDPQRAMRRQAVALAEMGWPEWEDAAKGALR
jgi:hypothetical protein